MEPAPARRLRFELAQPARAAHKSEFTPEFFDEASREWRANKIRLASGSFRYRCGREGCKNKVINSIDAIFYCKWHKDYVKKAIGVTPYVEEIVEGEAMPECSR